MIDSEKRKIYKKTDILNLNKNNKRIKENRKPKKRGKKY